MKDYITYAQKYPAIVAMLLPALLTTQIIGSYFPAFQENWTYLLARIGTLLPVALVYSAIGYFLRQLFRDTSKLIFQFPLFKEDETNMPTTLLLLRTGKNRLSTSMIDRLSTKIEEDFNIKLPTQEEEQQNIVEAKKTIADAVGKIREVTRTNPILLNYNIEFGFCRNYLGASVFALLLIMACLVFNLIVDNQCWIWALISFFIQLVLGLLAFIILKSKGYSYARALFNAYITDNYKTGRIE